jgi:hypothetical protein
MRGVTATVTLDGRVLLSCGRDCIELVAPCQTVDVLSLLAEALTVQGRMVPWGLESIQAPVKNALVTLGHVGGAL